MSNDFEPGEQSSDCDIICPHCGYSPQAEPCDGDVRQYKERIKRLEKAGNEVVYWFSPMAKHQLTSLHLAALNQWNAAKETKP